MSYSRKVIAKTRERATKKKSLTCLLGVIKALKTVTPIKVKMMKMNKKMLLVQVSFVNKMYTIHLKGKIDQH